MVLSVVYRCKKSAVFRIFSVLHDSMSYFKSMPLPATLSFQCPNVTHSALDAYLCLYLCVLCVRVCMYLCRYERYKVSVSGIAPVDVRGIENVNLTHIVTQVSD